MKTIEPPASLSHFRKADRHCSNCAKAIIERYGPSRCKAGVWTDNGQEHGSTWTGNFAFWSQYVCDWWEMNGD